MIDFEKRFTRRMQMVILWNTNKHNAFRILNSSIGDHAKSICAKAFSTRDPKTIWDALDKRFGSDSSLEISKVYEEISRITLLRNEPFVEFHNKLDRYFNILTTSGETVSEPYKKSQLLQGIVRSTRAELFATTLETCHQLKKNYHEIVQILMDLELRTSPVVAAPVIERKKQVVNLTQTVHSERKTYQAHPRSTARKDSQANTHSESRPKSKCKWCNKPGHLAQDCYQLDAFIATKNEKVALTQVVHLSELANSTAEIALGTQASIHVSGDTSILSGVHEIEPVHVMGYDGKVSTYHQAGDLGDFGTAVVVPTSQSIILSFGKLVNEGHDIEYRPETDDFRVTDEGGNSFLFSKNHKSTYTLELDRKESFTTLNESIERISMVSKETLTAEIKRRIARAMELHARLGHPSDAVLNKMITQGSLINCDVTPKDIKLMRTHHPTCKGCYMGKVTHQAASTTNTPRNSYIGDLVHTDLYFWEGRTYLMALDDMSNHLSSVEISSKSNEDVRNAIDQLCTSYNFYGHKITSLRTDCEAVFLSLEDYLMTFGIGLQITAPENHEKNIERYMRVLGDKARANIHGLDYQLPVKLYPYAIEFSVMAMNRVPNLATEATTPYELFTGKKLTFNKDLRAHFGEVGMFRIPYANVNSTKSAPRAELGIVVGSKQNSNGTLKVFLPVKNRVVLRSKFTSIGIPAELESYLMENYDLAPVEDYESPDEGSNNGDDDQDPQELTMIDPDTGTSLEGVNATTLLTPEEAITAELQQLIDQKVFTCVLEEEIPKEDYARIIPCSDFTVTKLLADGTVDKVKSRIVAGGTSRSNKIQTSTTHLLLTRKLSGLYYLWHHFRTCTFNHWMWLELI